MSRVESVQLGSFWLLLFVLLSSNFWKDKEITDFPLLPPVPSLEGKAHLVVAPRTSCLFWMHWSVRIWLYLLLTAALPSWVVPVVLMNSSGAHVGTILVFTLILSTTPTATNMLTIHSLLLEATDNMPGMLTKGCFEGLIAEDRKFHYYLLASWRSLLHNKRNHTSVSACLGLLCSMSHTELNTTVSWKPQQSRCLLSWWNSGVPQYTSLALSIKQKTSSNSSYQKYILK